MRIGTEIVFLETIDSTNGYISRNINTLNNGAVVWAMSQTKGKGRLNRSWVSDRNGNIYFSFLVKDTSCLKQITEFPIIVSVVLLRSLRTYFNDAKTKDLKLKWPNDILYKNSKVCGTLIELEGNSLVCGMGVNVELAPHIEGKKTGSLRELVGPEFKIKPADFIGVFCKTFNKSIDEYLSKGFAYFKSEWEQNCGHINKKVALSGGVMDNTPKTDVLFVGLHSDGGAVVIFDGSVDRRVVYSGELNV